MVQFAVGCVYQLPWLRNVSFQILPTTLASCQQCHDACPRAKHRSRIVAAHLRLGGGSTGHTSTCGSAQSEVGRNRFCAAQSDGGGEKGFQPCALNDSLPRYGIPVVLVVCIALTLFLLLYPRQTPGQPAPSTQVSHSSPPHVLPSLASFSL